MTTGEKGHVQQGIRNAARLSLIADPLRSLEPALFRLKARELSFRLTDLLPQGPRAGDRHQAGQHDNGRRVVMALSERYLQSDWIERSRILNGSAPDRRRLALAPAGK